MQRIIVFLLLTGLCFTLLAQPENAKAEMIDSLIRSYAAIKQFNGNVLVVQKGKSVFSKSYGFADFEWKIANDKQTKFRIGSITKQFTAMLIMQLKQDGKLDLDSAITTYLPWYRRETGNTITIRNLLAHTSALRNYTERPDFHNRLA